MLSCCKNPVTVLNNGVKVFDARPELGLHVAEEEGGGGWLYLADISQERHAWLDLYHGLKLSYISYII